MLRAHDISVEFGDVMAVDNVSIEVADGETVALVGRSGSGKTTLLRAIAGLVSPDTGQVLMDGIDVTSTPAHRRGIGLVFQDFALFPHLDVGSNIAYGIDPGPERGLRVSEALQRVDLPDMESRQIDQLSGGQAQRVALARTLASRPRVLLLDEPMGSLDRAYRRQVADELSALLATTGIPTILVTHDVDEAFALGDRVMVLERGRAVACGTPEGVWSQPGTADAARILGHTAVLDVLVTDGTARVNDIAIPIPTGTPDGRTTILIRSARVVDAGGVELPAAYSRFTGPGWTTGLHLGSGVLEVRTEVAFGVGSTARVAIDRDAVVIL